MSLSSNRLVRAALGLLCLSTSLLAFAAPPKHPWVTINPRIDKYAWFSNLESGAEVESPFVVRFGLSGIGIAAVKKPVAGTGHHHLLVDRDLPLDFTQPLPFNDQYIHFGKGQMETVLDLPPGEHTLRLVFADHEHIPNFVYSDVLTIKVVGKRAQGADGLRQPGITLLSPSAGSRVHAPFALIAHVSGFNVSHTDITEPDTGHLRFRITTPDGKTEVLPLTGGETELWLQPPAGRYTLSGELVSNRETGIVLATFAPVQFEVIPR